MKDWLLMVDWQVFDRSIHYIQMENKLHLNVCHLYRSPVTFVDHERLRLIVHWSSEVVVEQQVSHWNYLYMMGWWNRVNWSKFLEISKSNSPLKTMYLKCLRSKLLKWLNRWFIETPIVLISHLELLSSSLQGQPNLRKCSSSFGLKSTNVCVLNSILRIGSFSSTLRSPISE